MLSSAASVLLAAWMLPLPSGLSALEEEQWKSRPVIVFASSPDDPRLREQRKLWQDHRAGLAERDVTVWVSTRPSEQAAWRRRLGLPAEGFAAVLIGKDGGVKWRSAEPMTPEELFRRIDAMPMRQSELRRSP